MKPFLKEIAEELFESHGDRLEELCLVFPNRRAGLFFNKYMGACLKTPVWSPVILTIRDLMLSLSDLEYGDEVELISLLYREYSLLKENRESFDDFYSWGETMIADFDETDKYLIDAGDLFRNMAGLKDLESSLDYLSGTQVEVIQQFWNTLITGKSSEQKQQFIDIWNIMLPLYGNFRASLRREGIGYEGMIYRDVAEKISSGDRLELPAPAVAFIGFNALNRCEEILAGSLQKEGKALFYWDYDKYYTEKEWHEAGRFIRKNLEKFPDSGRNITRSNLEGRSPAVDVFSVPSGSGQSQIVSRILQQEVPGTAGWEETAVVLADEELLMPLLHALPEGMEEINVTMGYPVTAAPVFSLVEHLISLQGNAGHGKSGAYHFEDVLKILQHQYVSHQEDARELIQDMHSRNRIFIPESDLAVNDLFARIFRHLKRPGEIAAYLLGILEAITGREEGTEDRMPALELEFIYRIYTRIKRLNDVLERLELELGLPVFLKIFHKYLKQTRIPFSGEPLAGLQVMGILETRALDFSHVIMLSVNEGTFPKSSAGPSFIPYSLRKGFGLPTPDHQDAIYAYYFYRLIHRAGQVSLVYNNKTEGLNTGERSRFIHQLQYDPVFKVRELSSGFDIQTTVPAPIRVEKKAGIMEILGEYHNEDNKGRYLSPSALNTLINCSLRFYFRYVADLEEPDELREEIDSAMFGTLLHDVIRRIYDGMDRPVRREEIDRFLGQPGKIETAVRQSFLALFHAGRAGDSEIRGRDLIILRIMVTYTRRILEIDRESCPLHIHSLEREYRTIIPVETAGRRLPVKIGGKIDRIDLSGSTYRVLDYKSGRGNLVFKSIEGLFDGEERNRNEAAFQTLLYAKIFSLSGETGDRPVKPGLYLIRNMFSDAYCPDFGIGTDGSHTPVGDYYPLDEAFSENLDRLLSGLFDPATPFLQTGQEEHCRHCEFRGICHR